MATTSDDDLPGEVSLQCRLVDGSADLHTLTTVAGTYRFVSKASLNLFGWAPGDLLGKPQEAFVHPEDAARVGTIGEQVASGHEPVTTVAQFRCADGTYRWTESVSALAPGGGGPLIVSTVRDIGDRRRKEIDLWHQATTDPLTGVANRTLFMDRLEQALRRLERRQGLVAVLFLDLDGFKSINDTVGHLGGDSVLVQLAERLRKILRPEETFARLGGDEFAVVAEGLSRPEEALTIGNRLVADGRDPFDLGHRFLVCTMSVGIAVTSAADHGAERLLDQADIALYRAKRGGRDRAEMFNGDVRAAALALHPAGASFGSADFSSTAAVFERPWSII